MVREDDLDYEQQREANIRANQELLSSLGIAPVTNKAATRSSDAGVKPHRWATVAAGEGVGLKRQTRNSARPSETTQQHIEKDTDKDTDEAADGEGGDGDYEAQRAANIRANLELMMSLGLYQTSSTLNPKPAASKAGSKVKTNSSSTSSSSRTAAVERPKRITRSVSRTLDSPRKTSNSRMKRTFSDDFIHPSSKHSRRNSYTPSEEVDSDSDEYTSSYRARRANPFARRCLNPSSRNYRSALELQRSSERLGVRVYDPKRFGSIPGIPIGTWWEKRIHCSTDSIHAPTVAGISGDASLGCWSICLSGGYEDDIDSGEFFTYTGSGGRDLKGTKQNPKNLRTAPQSKDQSWDGKNAALKKSVETGKPVRVVRGYKGANEFCPKEGYVYSGLYRVKEAWMEKGASGFMVCRFKFERLAGQDALPTFDHTVEEDEVEEEEEGGEEANEQEDGEEDEIRQVTQREIRLLNRTKSTPPKADTIDLTSPSPPPSDPLPKPTSPHPQEPFDRSAYLIIPSSSSCSSSDEDEEVQMQLELHPSPSVESLAKSVAAEQSWRPILSRSRLMKRSY
ncbi:uncharacterized protein UTRI_06262 [Ustilago trichophora]|uniref:YDG domain-containing protein n=1 Tax=Ustilago trichophora TaxID=86804 RepID=A0A5C3EF85_9BASI|nr:uncharacterized protein UTRI_06262 [Ustilago trichophora]